MSPVKQAYDQFLRLESVGGDGDDTFALSETGDSNLLDLTEETGAPCSSSKQAEQSLDLATQRTENVNIGGACLEA